MKKVIYGILAVSLATNGYLFMQKSHVEKVEVIKEIVKEKPVDKVVMEKDEELIKAHLEALSEIEELKKKLADIENQQVNDLQESSADENETAETKGEFDKDFAKIIKNEKEQRLERFANESIDHEWAYGVQDEVQKVVLEAGLLEKYDLRSVDCKTTVCQLTIKPFDTNEKTHFTTMMSTVGAFMNNEVLDELGTSFDDLDKETKTIKIYLDKHKSTLFD